MDAAQYFIAFDDLSPGLDVLIWMFAVLATVAIIFLYVYYKARK